MVWDWSKAANATGMQPTAGAPTTVSPAPLQPTVQQPAVTTKSPEMNMLPVRKTLTEKYGVSNERIGYDPTSGYVTVDNQKLFKPPTNKDGTTYAGQDVFNSAAGTLNTLNNQNAIMQKVLHPETVANPYDTQIGGLLQRISDMIANPQQVDIYSSPEYAAAQQQAQLAALRGIRANQEATGASGFGRSTINTQGAQRIQNEADQNLMTQIVPQLIAQQQGKQQQQLGNLMGLLGALGQQQGVVDTRDNNAYTRAADMLNYLTGRQDTAYERQYQQGRDKVEDTKWNKTFGLNQMQVTAQLTGKLPDGTPTTAEQQRQLENLWDVASQTGTIPNELADMYGLKHGTPTMAAAQFAWQQTESDRNYNRGGLESDRNYNLAADDNARQWAQANAQNEPKLQSASPNEVKTLLQNFQLNGVDGNGDPYKYIPGQGKPTRVDWVKQTVQGLIDANYDDATISQVLRAAGVSQAEEDQIFGGK